MDSAAPSTAAYVRKVRSDLRRFTSSSNETPPPSWAHESNQALAALSTSLARANAAHFLANADGFLLTLDHVEYTSRAAATAASLSCAPPEPNSSEAVRRQRLIDAANLLACMSPHTRTMATQAAPTNATVATGIAMSAMAKSDVAGCDVAAAADSPEGIFNAIRRRLMALPPNLVLTTEAHIKECVEVSNALAAFLSGGASANPARLGVSVYLLDKSYQRPQTGDGTPSAASTIPPMAPTPMRMSVEAAVFAATTALLVARRLHRSATGASSLELTTAIDAALAGLQAQCATVDTRFAGSASALKGQTGSSLLSRYHAGYSEAEAIEAYESKENPLCDADVLDAVACSEPAAQRGRGRFCERGDLRCQAVPSCAAKPLDNHNLRIDVTEGCLGLRFRQDMDDRLARIAADIEFSETSSRARDLDQLIAFTRSALDGGIARPATADQLINERLRPEEASAEARMFAPVKQSLADAFDLGDDDDVAPAPAVVLHLPLERIARALAAP